MKAEVFIFNVHHGDSAVIRLDQDGKAAYIVVDSNIVNRNGVLRNPAYDFLKSRSVKEIDAVILTHLHGDHYAGLDQILTGFNVKKIVIPPFLSKKSEKINKQFKEIRTKIKQLVDRTPDEVIGRRCLSFAHIVKFLKENLDKVEEGFGPETVFRIPSFSKPIGRLLLPFTRIRGRLSDLVDKGDFDLDSFIDMNEASIVLILDVGDIGIVLGADSTMNQWIEHRRRFQKEGVLALNADALKVSHHGSRHNNNEDIFKYILGNPTGKTLLVSANGKTHPHDEFFELVSKFEMQPYCTGLAKQCVGENVHWIGSMTGIPREHRFFMANYEVEDLPVPCQGDIVLSVENNRISVKNSTGNVCVYRPVTVTEVYNILDY